MPKLPAVFVTHGGGPMPLLNEPNHRPLINFLKTAAADFIQVKPRAIVLVTAHWEADVVTVSTASSPPMLYDYGGFPEEAYKIQYPAPGAPKVAARVQELLGAAGIKHRADSKRGYDHGVFVPLKLLYPQADIPVVMLSILSSLQPQAHINLGRALAPLREEGVLILGSGATFHNFGAFRATGAPLANYASSSQQFTEYLNNACTKAPPEQRSKLLEAWASAPGGKHCQPREEHLLPLLVVAGAAGDDVGRNINDWELPAGVLASSYLFGDSVRAEL